MRFAQRVNVHMHTAHWCFMGHHPRGGGGGTLIFSYIRRLGPFFGFKILNFNIFWGCQKNKYFLGYEDFVDIFWGSSQNWTIFRFDFYAFKGIFLRSIYRMGIFFGFVKLKIFFGVLEIPDSFWGLMVDAGSEPTYAKKNESTPPPPWGHHTRAWY